MAEHKHRIGFTGLLLIEPKPQEPTKHQYDYDSATVDGFLVRHGARRTSTASTSRSNHATLAGHSFQHEVAHRHRRGIFGSIDINRGDYQNGWDTDQFPNSVDELALAVHEILQAGGFTTRRLQLRHQAAAPEHGPGRTCSMPTSVGWTRWHGRSWWPPTCWSRRAAARSEAVTPDGMAGSGREILAGGPRWRPRVRGSPTAASIRDPRSGRQERLENLVNQRIWSSDADASPKTDR